MTMFLKRQLRRLAADRVSVVPTDDTALQRAWREIRRAHPGVPDAEIRAVRGKRDSTDASIDWSESRPLILVGARTIGDGPDAILAYLLHQAAHALTPGGGVTSAYKGRWHTAEWRQRAESLGLEVSGTSQSITTLTDWGKQRHAAELELLGQL